MSYLYSPYLSLSKRIANDVELDSALRRSRVQT